MNKPPFFPAISLSVLVLAGAMAAFAPVPTAAQTAKKLDCKNCVKSKQVKNNGIKSIDIKNGQVKNADLGINAVTGSKIADGSVDSADLAANAVTLEKLGSGVTALGLSGVAVIGAADFRGEDGNSVDDWFVSSDGSVRGVAGGDPGCVVAPVHLPDGVTVTEVELIFVDDSPGAFGITFRRTSLLDGSPLILAAVDTAGVNTLAVMRRSDTIISQPIVDTVNFTYWIRMITCLGDSDQEIYGVRVFFD